MGNCQAIDAAALVIQHPDGRLERMYWSVPVSEVMRVNPGHYVSLIIPLQTEANGGEQGTKPKTVRFTRVKLLRPTETLTLGHAYRLVTSQEVMKVLKAKKYGKMKQQQKQQQDEVVVSASETSFAFAGGYQQGKGCQNSESHDQGMEEHHRDGQRMMQQTVAATGSGSRSKSWRPNLQSIAEGSS